LSVADVNYNFGNTLAMEKEAFQKSQLKQSQGTLLKFKKVVYGNSPLLD
jgi:hypothetical protein